MNPHSLNLRPSVAQWQLLCSRTSILAARGKKYECLVAVLNPKADSHHVHRFWVFHSFSESVGMAPNFAAFQSMGLVWIIQDLCSAGTNKIHLPKLVSTRSVWKTQGSPPNKKTMQSYPISSSICFHHVSSFIHSILDGLFEMQVQDVVSWMPSWPADSQALTVFTSSTSHQISLKHLEWSENWCPEFKTPKSIGE